MTTTTGPSAAPGPRDAQRRASCGAVRGTQTAGAAGIAAPSSAGPLTKLFMFTEVRIHLENSHEYPS